LDKVDVLDIVEYIGYTYDQRALMKKSILVIVLSILTGVSLIALEGYEVKTFHQDIEKNIISLDMVYNETTKNLIVIYKIKYRSFDEGTAFVTVRDAIQTFADEHGYKSYQTYSEDRIIYRDKLTEFRRFIVLGK